MYCPQCSHELRSSDRFCPNCAAPTIDDERTVISNKKKKADSPAWIAGTVLTITLSIFAIAVVATAVILGFAYLQNNSTPNDGYTVNPIFTTDGPRTTAPTPPPPTPKPRIEIVNSSFHVEASSYNYFEFTVSGTATVEGGFRAYGGREDIEVVLVDEDDFANWKNRLTYRVFYESGVTSRGKINRTLSSGTYYLIFSNRHAWVTNKTVAAEIYVQEEN